MAQVANPVASAMAVATEQNMPHSTPLHSFTGVAAFRWFVCGDELIHSSRSALGMDGRSAAILGGVQ